MRIYREEVKAKGESIVVITGNNEEKDKKGFLKVYCKVDYDTYYISFSIEAVEKLKKFFKEEKEVK